MDDSFAFRTTVPLRRQFDPTVVKLAVFVTIVVLSIGVFVDLGRDQRTEQFRACIARRGVERDRGRSSGKPDQPLDDGNAEEATEIALDAARAAFSAHRSFLDAGPAQLSVLEPAYTFVDGPSTTSEIVSVAATPTHGRPRSRGPDGMCHWIRAGANGSIASGTSSRCTGASVLDGSGTSRAYLRESPRTPIGADPA